MAKIFIPSIGVAMEEALLVRWLKEPGQEVSAEEPVAEIETDKAAMELSSPVSGSMGPHMFQPGAIIPVGTTIAEVFEEGEEGAIASGEPAPPSEQVGPAAAEISSTSRSWSDDGPAPHALSPRARRLAREHESVAQADVSPQTELAPRHAESPRARRLAREHESAASARAEVSLPTEPAPQGEKFRALIASKVAQSWREIPHFAVTREVDAEPMLATLELLRKGAPEPRPTLTDLLLRALAIGLRGTANDGPDDVGIAVATDHGVVIPVVHGVLAQDIAGLATSRRAAVERARSGRLNAQDLGASPPSTLSNLGSFGVDQFTGIIAVGQTSLLTVGRAGAACGGGRRAEP